MQLNESRIYRVILHESFFSLPLFHYKELVNKKGVCPDFNWDRVKREVRIFLFKSKLFQCYLYSLLLPSCKGITESGVRIILL